MEDLLSDFLADIDRELEEMPMTPQVCDGMVTTCNIISAYLMQRYVRSASLFANKKISYIEYDVTNRMRDEIFKIMDKIVDICNQKYIERNEANITDKDFKI